MVIIMPHDLRQATGASVPSTSSTTMATTNSYSYSDESPATTMVMTSNTYAHAHSHSPASVASQPRTVSQFMIPMLIITPDEDEYAMDCTNHNLLIDDFRNISFSPPSPNSTSIRSASSTPSCSRNNSMESEYSYEYQKHMPQYPGGAGARFLSVPQVDMRKCAVFPSK